MIVDLAERALDELLRANIAASLGILLVLAIRQPMRRAFGAQIAYSLWLLPPLIAAASLLPLPRGAASLASIIEIAPVAAWTRDAARTAPGLPPVVAFAWITGAHITYFALVLRQILFLKALGGIQPEKGGEGRLFRAATANAGPAVVGAIRPVIVIPSDFETRFTAQERQVILAHERAHLAAGDAEVNALLALAQCLCWFNPLVHLAVFRVRLDQELACDARVMEAQPGSRRSYAEAMLRTQIAQAALPLGCAWPSRTEHPLKERIAMLKSPAPTASRRLTGAGLIAVLTLGGGYVAWASQTPPTPVTTPVWLEKPQSRDLVEAYPPEALKQGLEGMATVQCKVRKTGILAECGVVSETPMGQGFGEAALQLTPRFKMKPYDRGARAAADHIVRIPIRFAASPRKPATE